MKRILKILFSMPVMIGLGFILCFAIGAATFIENSHGSQTARAVVYHASWFEILVILLGIHLTGMLIRFRSWQKGKWPLFIFHIGLLFIIAGFILTNRIGSEGFLHVREGQASSVYSTSKAFLGIHMQTNTDSLDFNKSLELSSIIVPGRFSKTFKLGDRVIQVRLKDFIPSADKILVEHPLGVPTLMLSVSEGEQNTEAMLQPGSQLDFMSGFIGFNRSADSDISYVNISIQEGKPVMICSESMSRISMHDRKIHTFAPNTVQPLESRTVYRFGDIRFAMRSYMPRAMAQAVPPAQLKGNQELPDAIVLKISTGWEEFEVSLFGGEGMEGAPVHLNIADLDVRLAYGTQPMTLPFSIHLNDFVLKRYPGSDRPSSFESHVTVIDTQQTAEFPYMIYMNHILRHRGFRLYQTSFDPDEKGTVLSVSYDPGTPVTYLGFVMVSVALLITLFQKKRRFRTLGRQLKAGRSLWVGMMLIPFLLGFYQTGRAQVHPVKPMEIAKTIDAEQSDRFGSLLVQDDRGRIKPVNAMAHEILWALGHPESEIDLSVNQIALGIWTQPELFKHVPIIPLKNPVIRSKLGLRRNGHFIAYADLFDNQSGLYKLSRETQRAYRKDKSARGDMDKDLVNLYDASLLCRDLFDGVPYRLFPVPEDSSNTWIARQTEHTTLLMDSLYTMYAASIQNGMESGDWSGADEQLNHLKQYQSQWGFDVIPRDSRIQMEILYYRLRLFERLMPVYLVFGFMLMVLLIIRNRTNTAFLEKMIKMTVWILAAGFMIQTAGLAIRWVASWHAPWTNKYESMMFIAWSVMLAGFFSGRRVKMALALSALFTGLMLFAGHLPWADPKLTNLHPVLKSMWLIIHVSVIVTSYGFFTTGFLLGLTVLISMMFITKKNASNRAVMLEQWSMVQERLLLIGLTLVTLGNFMGAVWANESWGRYWGWDPKETWTLIVIMAYVMVLHTRFIHKMNRIFTLNCGSVIAYFTVLMTYIGVNLYLSGLHAYATGERMPVPFALYVIITALIVIMLISYRKSKYLNKDSG